MSTWLDMNADGIALMLAFGLIGALSLALAMILEAYQRREMRRLRDLERARAHWRNLVVRDLKDYHVASGDSNGTGRVAGTAGVRGARAAGDPRA